MTDQHPDPMEQPPNGASVPRGGYPPPQGHPYPQQYQQQPPPKKKRGLFRMGCLGILALFLVIAVVAAVTNSGKKSPSASAPTTSTGPTPSSPTASSPTSSSNNDAPTSPSAASPTESNTTSTEPPVSASKSEATEATEAATSSQGAAGGETGAAVEAARSYLDTSAFSKRGLIQQLSSDAGDKYPLAVATQAVNSLTDVDWTEQAKKAARSYLETSAFSKRGLVDQLSSDAGDQYTIGQATAAVASLTDVDWNAQAAKAAKSYLDTMPMSCAALKDQLSSEAGDKYTPAQAAYGASQTSVCK